MKNIEKTADFNTSTWLSKQFQNTEKNQKPKKAKTKMPTIHP